MRISVVNATNGGLSGGYIKYLLEFIPSIINHPDVKRVHIFLSDKVRGNAELEKLNPIYFPSDDYKKGFRWIKSKINYLSPDIVFFPTARWIEFNNIPTIIMVRNMEPLVRPFKGNPLQEGIKNLFRARICKNACQRADAIIAVSKFVKSYLNSNWNINNSKITIIYHGVELEYNSVNKNMFPPPILNNLDEDFIFTAGSIRPARGLEDIINAIGILKNTGYRIKLVIAGKVDSNMANYMRKLDNIIRKFDIGSQIYWTGSLAKNEMSWCYYNCELFIMTSRTEASPNIVLESLLHGCVCISTDSNPMPEFYDSCAIYYSEENSYQLAQNIIQGLRLQKKEREEIIQKALLRAKRFSWDDCLDKTITTLKNTSKINK